MKFMNMSYLHKYCEEAGEGKDGSAGGNEPTVEQLQKTVADLQKSNEAILLKNTELLGEAKKAKNLKREADEVARKATEDNLKANNDFEQLHKSAMQENEALKLSIKERDSNASKEKVKNKALKIAGELAEGHNIELLSDHIAKRLKDTEEGVKVTDEQGNATISSEEDLKTIFKNNERFASLLKGNQSSGGGATGGENKGGGAAKVMTRAEHDALDAVAKAKFFKNKGQLVD